MDEDAKNLEKQLKKELNEKEMLTPYIPNRGKSFTDMIHDILHTHGNIKDKYLKLLLSEENIKIYENAFTSNSVNSFIDIESGQEVKVHTGQVKENYLKAIGEFKKELMLKCAQYRIDFVEADIHLGYKQVLSPYLAKRQKML